MKNTAKVFSLLILAFIICSCTSNRMMMKNINSDIYPKEIDFLLEPDQSVGVSETPAVKTGKVTITKGIVRERLIAGEGFLNMRIIWKVLAVNPDGREFIGQMVFYGINEDLYFFGYPIIDGIPDKDAKVIYLSTLGQFAYDLSGKEIPISDLGKFQDNKNGFRTKFVLQNGTRIGDMKKYPEFLSTIKRWNKYQTRKGIIYSPIKEDELKKIARINPKYSYGQTLIAESDLSLTLNPIGTIIGVGLDCIDAMNSQSDGWDFSSKDDRNKRNARVSAIQTEYLINLMRNLKTKQSR